MGQRTREEMWKWRFTKKTRNFWTARSQEDAEPDVVERRHLDDDYKNQEIGFSISAAFLEIPGNRIVLHFCGDSTTKTYEIDIKALRKEQKSKGFWGRLFHKDKDGEHKEDYEEWFKRHKADRRTLRKQRHTHFEQNPLISIVIPLYCTPTPYLKELIDSVRAQSYTNWQLCLADGSPDQKVEEYIQKRYGKDQPYPVQTSGGKWRYFY